MPASEVMSLYRQHKLHSGPGGPVVKSKKQATAIQISMARKEGHDIPKPKGSFQQGGLVPETGDYRVHSGEEVTRRADIARRTGEAYERAYQADRARSQSPVDTLTSLGPDPRDPRYAVEGLQGNVAQRMREQGERAAGIYSPPASRTAPGVHPVRPAMTQQRLLGSFDEGGTVPATGNYRAHAGEELVPAPDRYAGARQQNFSWPVRDTEPDRYAGATRQNFTYPVRDTEMGGAPDIGRGRNFYSGATEQNFSYPIRDTEERPGVILGTFDRGGAAPAARARPGVVLGSFDEGGTVQQTGDYQAQQGELVMPPPERASAPAPTTNIQDTKKKAGGGGGGVGDNPYLSAMQANVNAPLHRVEGFKHGGTIPRTGIYRLHAGEHVIPKSLAGHYREMKAHG